MSALAISRSRGGAGLMRSARLMRALGAEAAPVWNELSPQEARALSAAMDALDEDGQGESDALDRYKRTHSGHSESPGEANVWRHASQLETRDLVELTHGQHPQALALLVSRLEGAASARLLKAIETSLAVDVMQRLLNLGEVHPSALVALETIVSAWMQSAGPASRNGGHEGIARIFDRMDSRAEKSLLSALDTAVPGASQRVRQLMFTFDDLAHLDPAGLQTLLSAADRTRLTYALKGANAETAAAFYRNMTQRAGELLREEIDMLGAVRRSETEAARVELVDLARSLIERGEIRAGRPQDEDELVE